MSWSHPGTCRYLLQREMPHKTASKIDACIMTSALWLYMSWQQRGIPNSNQGGPINAAVPACMPKHKHSGLHIYVPMAVLAHSMGAADHVPNVLDTIGMCANHTEVGWDCRAVYELTALVAHVMEATEESPAGLQDGHLVAHVKVSIPALHLLESSQEVPTRAPKYSLTGCIHIWAANVAEVVSAAKVCKFRRLFKNVSREGTATVVCWRLSRVVIQYWQQDSFRESCTFQKSMLVLD